MALTAANGQADGEGDHTLAPLPACRLRGSPQDGGTLRPSLLTRKEARPRSLTVNVQNVPWAARDVPYVGRLASGAPSGESGGP